MGESGGNEVGGNARKKVAFVLTSGANDVAKARSALMFASIAQCFGCDAVVFCVQDGADAVVKGKIVEEGKIKPGQPTFEQRLEEARAVGVRLQLCEQVAKNRNISSEDLLEGVEIVDGSHLITYLTEYDGVVSF